MRTTYPNAIFLYMRTRRGHKWENVVRKMLRKKNSNSVSKNMMTNLFGKVTKRCEKKTASGPFDASKGFLSRQDIGPDNAKIRREDRDRGDGPRFAASIRQTPSAKRPCP